MDSAFLAMRTLIRGVLSFLAAMAAFAADPIFRVGDKVEARPMSDWWACTVTKVNLVGTNYVGGYSVRCDLADGSSKEYGVPTNRIRTSTGQAAQAVAQQRAAFAAMDAKGPGGRYEARNPSTCASTREPASGAITPDKARQYFMCGAETEDGSYLTLVENVRVTGIGKARRYNGPTGAVVSTTGPGMAVGGTDTNMPQIDVTQPVYDLRGSYDSYRCTQPGPNGNSGHNCNVMVVTDASGVCYRTTFGDWKCKMSGIGNFKHDMPPPK